MAFRANAASFSRGSSTRGCVRQYGGPNVACFAYDPDLTTWTAFFRTADGSLRTVGKIPSEGECQRYIGIFKPDIPAACRQLAMPNTCSASCVMPIPPQTPPPPPAALPVPSPPLKGDDIPPNRQPEPAKTDPIVLRSGQLCDAGWTQKQCTEFRLSGLLPPATEEVAQAIVDQQGPPPVRPADVATSPERLPARRVQTQPRPPEPFKTLIDVVMLPFDFLSYPGRRAW
jgi:hypothetical protein